MPTQTFFNLPEAKRKRFMDAVWQEFTTVSYMDASINKIIQAADISRGSFYQYFAGKADVFAYALGTLLETGKKMFTAQLMAHNNNLFEAILGLYELILWKNTHKHRSPEAERIQTLIHLNTELDMAQFADYLDCDADAKNVLELLNLAGYTLDTPLECHALIHMLTSVCMANIMDTLRHPTHEDRNRQLLEQQLELICRALPRPEKEGTVSCSN